MPDAFLETVDSLVQAKPTGFSDIHRILGPNRADTLMMRHMANTSAINQYAAGQSYALNELGRAYRNISRYIDAVTLHREAQAVAEKADNLELRVYSLNNLGVVYRRISSIRMAMDFHQRALELAQSVKNPSSSLKRSINVSLNGIGNLYAMLEQHDEAIDYFERSLQLEAELGNTLGLAVNQQNIGKSLEDQGELDQALERYQISYAYNDEIDNDMGRVICNTSIARIYLKQNRTEQAITLLDQTLPVADHLGDGFLVAPVYIDLGWGQMQLGQYDKAEKNMLQGLELAQNSDLRASSARAKHLLSQLFEKKGDFKKALGFKVEADSIEEEILSEGTVRYVNDVLFRYNTQKAQNEMELLAQENKMYQMELRTTRTTLLISGIALALLAGIFYILYRQYQLKNEKKVLTLEQSMLRSQMNPHFLFNSLNSIKLYIINNEQKNAVHYLNKFSKLVRKILEASSVREIPLAEELETVELYMIIENIRFSNEINFNIHVDEHIDTHTVRIPSLILQPFLENALWHGLSSKQGEKNINVHLSSDRKGYINIAIIDNGIGRTAAEKLKRNKVLKRNSVGIDITRERLANFAKEYQNPFYLEIVDLYDDRGEASGTKVVIHLPTT
ncbi:tetratricopeptide repeat protein [Pricia sp. S334]|uniref:Tetratricopeptide repeat protein n=1 Tax=Pricia mediterranea TaxID=3076079 RepID=A0ABU3L4N8_9FLAO|nr:tetratricopeptide repeat protein [Pricia sp. S334]MDT7828711.1 tetratricopeptide repeat protein [Pricia sp. S334]